jgi:hypothetical protein
MSAVKWNACGYDNVNLPFRDWIAPESLAAGFYWFQFLPLKIPGIIW